MDKCKQQKFLQLAVCVFLSHCNSLSLFSEISTCDGLLSHDALHQSLLDHGAALTPAGEVLRQKRTLFPLPSSISLSQKDKCTV